MQLKYFSHTDSEQMYRLTYCKLNTQSLYGYVGVDLKKTAIASLRSVECVLKISCIYNFSLSKLKTSGAILSDFNRSFRESGDSYWVSLSIEWKPKT